MRYIDGIRLILLFHLLYLPIGVFAQSFLWTNQGEGLAGDINQGNDLAIDKNGDIFVVGEFKGSITLDHIVLKSKGESDIFLAKYNDVGEVLWAVKAGGLGYDIGQSVTVDTNGYVYITGSISSEEAYFENTLLSLRTNSHKYNRAIFLAKYSPSGSLVWVKAGTGEYPGDGTALSVDQDNTIYLLGHSVYTISFGDYSLYGTNDNIFIAKFNENGEIIDAFLSGGHEYKNGYDIAVDQQKNIFITGMFRNNLQFGDATIYSNSSQFEGFIGKFSSTGVTEWLSAFGGKYSDKGVAITVDASGNSYITGSFENNAYFGSIHLTSDTIAGSMMEEIFIAKYNADGDVIWAKNASGYNGGESGTGIVVDDAGNVFVTGVYTTNNGMFDEVTLTTCGDNDLFVAHYNVDGDLLKIAKAGGKDMDYSLGIAVNEEGNCFITGYISGSSAYFGSKTKMANTSKKFFITKLSENEWKYGGLELILPDTICSGGTFPLEYIAGCTAFPFDAFTSELWFELSNRNSNDFPSLPRIVGKGKNTPVECTLPEDLEPGNYFIRATVKGEVHSGSVKVAVQCLEQPDKQNEPTKPSDVFVFIPNVFTPNGDFINDVFKVKPEGNPPFSMEIFDRWGKTLFSTNEQDKGWNGESCPSGVYYYKISIGDKIHRGWLQLIR